MYVHVLIYQICDVIFYVLIMHSHPHRKLSTVINVFPYNFIGGNLNIHADTHILISGTNRARETFPQRR